MKLIPPSMLLQAATHAAADAEIPRNPQFFGDKEELWLQIVLLAAPYYTPATRVPHHQKQQIFFKVFFFQKEGDSKNRNSKGRDHFPSKVELIMLLLRRRTSRYSTGIGVRPDSLTSTVLGAVLLVVEATRKSAQLKFNWVSCRE